MDFNNILGKFDDLGIKNEGLTPDDPAQKQMAKQAQVEVAVEQTAKTNDELSASDWAQLAGVITESKASIETVKNIVVKENKESLLKEFEKTKTVDKLSEKWQQFKEDAQEKPVNEGYKGWTYSSHEEDYDDVVKLSHVATKDGKEVSMDWSPYNKPTDEEFKLWVDLGMPTRKAVNGIGPLDKDDLMKLAKTKQGTHKLLQKESTEAEKRVSTKLKNIDRLKKAISDVEHKLHQERMKKEREQYVKDNPDSIYKEQESAIGGAAAPDAKAADVVKATQTLKTASQSPATTKSLAKAIDSASQGTSTSQQDMKALEPMMDVIKTAAENPELANQLKPLITKAKQLQQKQ